MNRFSDIELVHGWDDYGRSGKKKQHNKKKQINASPSKPPFQSMHWKIFPGERSKNKKDIKTSSKHLLLKKDIYTICQVTGGTAFSKLSFQLHNKALHKFQLLLGIKRTVQPLLNDTINCACRRTYLFFQYISNV